MEREGSIQESSRGTRGWARAIKVAAPIMIAYVAIGLPCGILESKAGLTPWMVFLLSFVFYSGAGQFMLPGMVMAGATPLSIILSISFVNTRQILYSTAFAPYLDKEKKLPTFLFSATVTDESFGVNLDRFEKEGSWRAAAGLRVNVLCLVSWGIANIIGALLGPVIDLPTAVMSFAMTSIFICLLVTQPMNSTAFVVIAATFAAVFICKLAGLTGPAIFIGALVGVAAGILKENLSS